MSLGGAALLVASAFLIPLVGAPTMLLFAFLWFPLALLRIAEGTEWVVVRGRLRRRHHQAAPPVVATVFLGLAVWLALAMVVILVLRADADEPAARPDLVIPLVTAEGCVLDRAVVDGVAPTTFQVVETRLCGPEARRCWRRYSLTGGKVVELGTVCEGTQPRELSPRWP